MMSGVTLETCWAFTPWKRPVTTGVYKPEAANTVWISWWWAMCRSKHVEPWINFGKINSITKLHLVGISTESYYDKRIHNYQKSVNVFWKINPLNAELNPICYLLALLAHHFLHVSRVRVKSLTLRLLTSYIYGAPILDVSRSHTTTQHSR